MRMKRDSETHEYLVRAYQHFSTAVFFSEGLLGAVMIWREMQGHARFYSAGMQKMSGRTLVHFLFFLRFRVTYRYWTRRSLPLPQPKFTLPEGPNPPFLVAADAGDCRLQYFAEGPDVGSWWSFSSFNSPKEKSLYRSLLVTCC
jgi:hypothetical protein